MQLLAISESYELTTKSSSMICRDSAGVGKAASVPLTIHKEIINTKEETQKYIKTFSWQQ